MSCAKTKFKTEAEAEIALYNLRHVRRNYKRQKTPIRYYLCNLCQYWHLTSKEAIEEEEDNTKLIHEDKFRTLLKNSR
jgi:hypothetical protein